MTRLDRIPIVITASCLLHKFILLKEKQADLQDIVLEPEPEVPYEGIPEVEREEAFTKRDEMANLT